MSMSNIPLSVYDFFAYLVPGEVVLASLDLAIDNGVLVKGLLQDKTPLVVILVWIVVAYLLGQLVASPARKIEGYAEWVFWHPSEPLFKAESEIPKWRQRLLGIYYEPLPKETQLQVRYRLKVHNGKAKDLYWRALGALLPDQQAMARLGIFETQSGLCRNLACAFLVLAACLWVAWYRFGQSDALAIVGSIFGFILMAGRFLRFRHEYAFELFLMYARESTRAPAYPH